jgi:hypothetical protein
MNPLEFMKRWYLGTKQYASSQLGVVEAQFYISAFITLGLVIGCFERKVSGDATLAYIFFAFFLFQLLTTKQLWTAYRMLFKQWKMMKQLQKGDVS